MRWIGRPLPTPPILLAALALAALFSSPSGAADAPAADPVVDRIQRAAAAQSEGELEAAAALFVEADRLAEGRSLHAAAGLCQVALALDRPEQAIAAAERWIELATNQAERAGGHHYLGLAHVKSAEAERYEILERRALAETARGEVVAGDSLRRAVAALRIAAAEGTEGRHFTLLSLADALVRLGEYAEALEVLAEYPAAGGVDLFAEDLRCWARYATKHVTEVPPVGGGFHAIASLEGPDKPPMSLAATSVGRQILDAIDRAGPMSVRLIVDAEGRVACARLLKPERPSRLHRGALETLRKSRYEPGHLGGVPVAAIVDENYGMAEGSDLLAPDTPLPPEIP
jgi:hypothetical protein